MKNIVNHSQRIESKKQRIKIIFPIRTNNKIGRNDICFCGSGKKYKLCCLNRKKMFFLFRIIKRLFNGFK